MLEDLVLFRATAGRCASVILISVNSEPGVDRKTIMLG